MSFHVEMVANVLCLAVSSTCLPLLYCSIGYSAIDNCNCMLLLFINILWKSNAIHRFVFRAKYLKSLSKSGESPFFLGNDAKNPIFRYIYDLLNDGIRGATKKDAVTTILAEIAVGPLFRLLFAINRSHSNQYQF